MKLALAKISLVFVGVLLILLLGEVVARVYYQVAYNVPLFRALNRPDRTFGWEGRRRFGDLQPPPDQARRFRLLVVGDSMTAGANIRDADLYSSVLGQRLNMEVFTYGGEGYGTLQEYMVIDQYLPIVRPHLVLLQVSYNDFINNSFELERASYYNNNLAIRPYLEGKRIRYRFPSRLGSAASQSRLVYWFVMQSSQVTATLATKRLLHTVEYDMEHGLSFEPLRRAVTTTETIVSKLKARLGDVPLAAFLADPEPQPYWRAIFQSQDISFFEGVPRVIADTERKLVTSVRPDGAHWDARGHHVVGEALARWLSESLSRQFPNLVSPIGLTWDRYVWPLATGGAPQLQPASTI